MRKQGLRQKDIAEAIGKDKSVVSRELRRNATPRGGYNFAYAQGCADDRKRRLRKCRRLTPEVRNRIERYMRGRQWSPEQIAGYCRRKGYAMVSVERIYQYIRNDRAAGGDLYTMCRHRLRHRRRPAGPRRTPIKGRVGIEHRPPQADGTRFGDWEMDTIVGKGGKGAMLTLVERSAGYSIISRLPGGKDARGVADAVFRALAPFKGHVLTITTDNGTEFALHADIARRLGTRVFFARPYHSWEKGLIEYTNKLYRQYIPKKADFRDFSEQQIKHIQRLINDRPRKKLDFETPAAVFFRQLK